MTPEYGANSTRRSQWLERPSLFKRGHDTAFNGVSRNHHIA